VRCKEFVIRAQLLREVNHINKVSDKKKTMDSQYNQMALKNASHPKIKIKKYKIDDVL
jgi:hypothetical protein